MAGLSGLGLASAGITGWTGKADNEGSSVKAALAREPPSSTF